MTAALAIFSKLETVEGWGCSEVDFVFSINLRSLIPVSHKQG